ncbi:dihydroorotase [candidate division KSB1 bacterium]|nr:dihydroorotase [candidate division KSB1 bacterium]
MQTIDRLLICNAEIIDFAAGEQKKIDLVICGDRIDKVGQIDADAFSGLIFDASDHVIVPGLMDMHVHLREPGREDEETIESGCAAAMAGGFTTICAMPNTDPPCDSQEDVRFLKKRAESQLVDVLPIAAITKGRAGKEITEMADLLRAGAVAFSDDGSPVSNNSVMRRACEYASMYDAVIVDHCEDVDLAADGHMNEGEMSTRLGIAGIPNAAEAIQVYRDIELARLTGCRIHIAHISTRESVQAVRRAKQEGLPVTCEVTPHHLMFSDKALVVYDTNLKMNPPLRTEEDIAALEQGLKDGTIDVIASDHAPHSIEEKDVEFEAAPFGIIGLETLLGVVLKRIVERKVLTLQEALYRISTAPRKVLNLPVPQLRVGEAANLSVIHPTREWVVDVKKTRSRSRNTPYGGMTMLGQVAAVINKGLLWQP